MTENVTGISIVLANYDIAEDVLVVTANAPDSTARHIIKIDFERGEVTANPGDATDELHLIRDTLNLLWEEARSDDPALWLDAAERLANKVPA